MADRDLISIAKTGSGKTLAFLLPCYRKMDQRGGGGGRIQVLVLAPTRELATQIQEEAEKFGRGAGYASAVAYGGAPKRDQLAAIRNASVLVATPGRLNDFLEAGQVDLSHVFYLVMDEADRMLDMGFEPQIREIVKRVPRRRQTLMFSATWPEEVRRLAHDFLSRPVHIQVCMRVHRRSRYTGRSVGTLIKRLLSIRFTLWAAHSTTFYGRNIPTPWCCGLRHSVNKKKF
jgi:ATP-dependent RNA helicase DDX5/DBP2